MPPAETQPPKTFSESLGHPFWAMEVPEALAVLRADRAGLSEGEVRERRERFGPNEIRERQRLTGLRIVLNQFRSPFILVLIAAGIITVFLRESVEAVVIFAAVAVNTVLGYWQESKAESALALLKTYVRTRVRVRRAGRERELDAVELVPGDSIRVSQGDRVPADARLFFASNLEADEAVLTGESLPVAKDLRTLPAGAPLAERTSMVYSGTLIVAGFGDAVVTATGDHTEFGRIASLVAEQEREPTPLQRSIARFTARAGGALGALVAVLFGLGLFYGHGLYEMFLIAVAVAVSAVPEGLPIALTVILAVGVERLAKRKGVARKLLAAETLGSTTLILTDKTGTLTEARMELAAVQPYGRGGAEAERSLLRDALLNTDVVIENPGDPPEAWRLVGRPLEAALVRDAAARGATAPEVLAATEVLERLPFSSEHKFSATASCLGSRCRLVLFGAPEVLLDFSNLPAGEHSRLEAEIAERASSGERVLGVASRDVPAAEAKLPTGLWSSGFTFRGFLSFRDPLRPRVGSAIRRIRTAGVRTVIVTGDHRGTAEAVARELGLVDGRGAVLTGSDLNNLNPDERAARADQVAVWARVTPEQKVAITKLYRAKGEVVAVTGDGVNDAPALQVADIGVAVGSGTDVAKSAADLVILDDNFETIVAAIEEGRNILGNIRKVIVYLLSDSLDELFLIGGSLLTGLALPISALQILFVNFFSDSFPAVALAFERGIDGLGAKPRKLDRNLFDPEVRFLILVIGVSTSVLLFVLYAGLLALGFPLELVRTFTFASFATYTLFLAFSVRSLERGLFTYNPFSNPWLVVGVGVGLVLTGLVIYLEPLRGVFGTVPLSPAWLLGVLGVGALNIAAVELGKWLFRRRAW